MFELILSASGRAGTLTNHECRVGKEIGIGILGIATIFKGLNHDLISNIVRRRSAAGYHHLERETHSEFAKLNRGAHKNGV
jgi:hypothetical protein